MPSPNRNAFVALNSPVDSIPECMESFTLSATTHTDLWRKTPPQDVCTAPILYKQQQFPFVSAEVSVCADLILEWDQAGLVISTGAPPGQGRPLALDSDGGPPPYSMLPSKWLKVGLEFCNEISNATSVYATADGSDWSRSALQPGRRDLRVKFERIGYALWVHYEDHRYGWLKIREITGFFCGVQDKSVWVGVYASRPASFPGTQDERHRYFDRHLHVGFENLEIY